MLVCPSYELHLGGLPTQHRHKASKKFDFARPASDAESATTTRVLVLPAKRERGEGGLFGGPNSQGVVPTTTTAGEVIFR